jgi:hypothetical protein
LLINIALDVNFIDFSGIATVLAVGILSIPQLGTQDLSHALEWLFMIILPNFCLGQGLVDFYSNFEFLHICKPVLPFCPIISNPCCKGICVYLFVLYVLFRSAFNWDIICDSRSTLFSAYVHFFHDALPWCRLTTGCRRGGQNVIVLNYIKHSSVAL